MKSLQNKRITLIGGGGFIGHNLALKLASQGAIVSIIDGLQVNNLTYFASTSKNIINRELYLKMIYERLELLAAAGIKLYEEDARNYHRLSLVMNEIRPEIVVQLAAVAHADRSNKDPYSTFDHSLRTLENALDISRDNVEHFIYLSSSMVYGNFLNDVVYEETQCNPIGIYGALKLSGEKMVIAYNQVFNLPYTIIRPSALYGERCVSRRVCQIFIENALMSKDIMINGDGSEKLDFTYIEDLVDGIEKVMTNPNSINQIFNLTYGESRSINELAEIVQRYFPELSISYKPKDILMPTRGTLSVEKARDIIGYNPQYSLENGIAEYIQWYKQFYTEKYVRNHQDSI